jgi:hypothetical protein
MIAHPGYIRTGRDLLMQNNQNTIILLTNKEWSAIDGNICRVIDFNPIGSLKDISGKVKSMDKSTPYASVTLEVGKLGKNVTGYICHRMDFENLWAAFKERTVRESEDIIMIWTNKHYNGAVKLFSAFMPKVYLAIFPKGAYNFLMLLYTDANRFKQEIVQKGPELLIPIAEWKPEVMDLHKHWFYGLAHLCIK